MSLSHLALATPGGGPGACMLTSGRQFVRLASGLSEECVKKQCGSEVAWLSTFSTSVRELQQWDKTVTTNWTSRNWGGMFSEFPGYDKMYENKINVRKQKETDQLYNSNMIFQKRKVIFVLITTETWITVLI